MEVVRPIATTTTTITAVATTTTIAAATTTITAIAATGLPPSDLFISLSLDSSGA